MTRAAAHEVIVPCDCGDLEHCRMELYVSDIRIMLAEVRRLYRRLESIAALATAS